jgi:hypothetical protein
MAKRQPQFCREEKRDPALFDKQSFRTISPNPDTRIIIACPKGKWNNKHKRCKVGTKTISILRKVGTRKCPVFKRIRKIKRARKHVAELGNLSHLSLLPLVIYTAIGYIAYRGFSQVAEKLQEQVKKLEKTSLVKVE